MSVFDRFWRTVRHSTPRQLAARALQTAREAAYPHAGALLSRAYPDEPAARLEIPILPALRGLDQAEPIAAGPRWEPLSAIREILRGAVGLAVGEPAASGSAPRMAAQLRFLAEHLEWHLLGSDLIAGAAAVTAGAAAISFPGSAAIYAAGASALARELDRQVLADGGHAERTPQLHASLLRDLLVALAIARARGLPLPIEPQLARMLRWLGELSCAAPGTAALPDLPSARAGAAAPATLPCWNDSTPAADEVAAEASALASRLGVAAAAGGVEGGVLVLPDTGWTQVCEADHRLIFDQGPLGPRGHPGHGHSDALSVELCWSGLPVLCDTGASSFEDDPIRRFERSAAAHATVTVDGLGPDELWGVRGVGARGKVSAKPRWERSGVHVLRGKVDAPQGWDQQRTVIFWPGRILVIIDRIDGEPDGAEVLARLPFAPDWAVGPRSATHASGLTLGLEILRGELHGFDRDGHLAAGLGKRRPRAVWRLRADLDGVAACSISALGAAAVLTEAGCTLSGGGEDRLIPLGS